MKEIIKVPETLDRRKKTWRKLLQEVDVSRTNGYAFVGDWLRAGEKAELEVGSYILSYDEAGSMKNWYPVVRVHEVTAEGTEEVFSWEGDVGSKGWALEVRDGIAAIINNESPVAVLSEEEKELVEQLRSVSPERLKAILATL